MQNVSNEQPSTDGDGNSSVVAMEGNPSLGMRTKFLKVPIFVYFIAVFVLIGAYFIFRSYADTVSLTQVWDTTAAWQTGSLNNVVASNNVVTLASNHNYKIGHKRYATGYSPSGSITLNFNAGSSVSWDSLTPVSNIPRYTNITYQERTSTNNSTWSAWSSNVSSLSSSQYIQIRANLSTGSSSATPTLSALTLVYVSNTPSPTVNISANPASITSGQTSTINWTSANATSCSASGAWSGSEATSGSIVTSILNATSTYTISCTASGQTPATASTTVTVTPATTGSNTTLGCTSGGIVAPCIGSSTTGASGWGTPIFDDEFTKDSSLNSKWSTGWWSTTKPSGPVNTLEDDCYTPSQVSLNSTNGLDLNFKAQSNTCGPNGSPETEPYDGAIVTTDPYGVAGAGFEYTYGFAEALVYMPPSGSGIANWPGFWATTNAGAATYNEQDIVEGLAGQACYHYHMSTAAPGGCASGNYSGWHTFAADWKSGSVTYYYDGKDVGTITNSGIISTPEYLIIDHANATTGDTIVAPADMYVKYVRVWQ